MNADQYKMRQPCKFCGKEAGIVEKKNGQNTVRCSSCGKHNYNAPKTETGEAVRNIQSRPDINPSTKAKVHARDGGRCWMCGTTAAQGKNIHIGHMISVSECRTFGLKESWINDERNLILLCEECNIGMGPESVTPKLAVAVLFWRQHGRVAA